MNERIKLLRTTLGLTQQKFSDKIGVKPNTIIFYETGRRNPGEDTISLICSVFRVRRSWLCKGEGEMFLGLNEKGEVEPGEPISLAKRIKLLRKTLGLSQQEFGNKICCKGNTISQYETSKTTPSAAVLNLICSEYKVSKLWFRDGIGDKIFKKEDPILQQLASMLKDPYRNQVFRRLPLLSDDEWESFERITQKLFI